MSKEPDYKSLSMILAVLLLCSLIAFIEVNRMNEFKSVMEERAWWKTSYERLLGRLELEQEISYSQRQKKDDLFERVVTLNNRIISLQDQRNARK